MRHLLAYLFFVLSAVQGWRDWQATMGEGNAYRLSSTQTQWEVLSPGTYQSWFPILEASAYWDPVLSTILGLPLAVILFVIGLFFYLIRRRKERKRS